MKKFMQISTFLAVLILCACSSSPQSAVEKLEKEKADMYETSGYNACMQKIEQQLATETSCVNAKLSEQGYTDGINCIENFNDPACKSTARYNAEVYAGKDCATPPDKALNPFDCMSLLK